MRCAILGYGNPLRSDDGVGWRVAEAVKQRWGHRVTVLMGQQPVPEWAAVLADVDLAFIVDASLTAGSRVRARRLWPTPRVETGLGAHQYGPHSLLGLAQAVYGCAPVTYLVPLPTHNLEFGESLSPMTARAGERAVRLLDRRLSALLSVDPRQRSGFGRDVHVDARQHELRLEPRTV